MNRIQSQLVLLFVLCCCFHSHAASTAVTVSGEWRFQIDRQDSGITDRWFEKSLPNRIQLPGALQSQGYGDEISIDTPWVLSLYDRLWYLRDDFQAFTNAGNVKVPFVCQPPRHYLGAAWYQKEIEIPQEWNGQRVVLFLERPHWESRVWFDNRLIGTNNSLCVPHEYELGLVNASGNSPAANITPGKHTISVRVDNRMLLPYRPDAHAVSDSLGSSWNGIAGKMELRTTPPVWIEDLQMFPDLERGLVRFRATVGNVTGTNVSETLFVQVLPEGTQETSRSANTIVKISVTEPHQVFEGGINISGRQWDEFSPVLYRGGATLRENGFMVTVPVGFRTIRTDGTRLIINGRETHLRGTHQGGDFPLTGYPPTDVEYWRKLIRTCQEWGLNHMRFHSFCPPEAAFQAADELGFYLQPEPGMWNTFDPGSPMEKMLYLETERMIKAYGNHPSFVMFAPSNEPKGRWRQVLPKWVEHFRTNDPRRLYTTGTGFTDADAPGPLDKVDYTATQRFGQRLVRRESAWFGRDYSGSIQGVNVPIVTHELGQWCAYPDFSVINKFTGYMRPGNYEIFRESAARNGVLERNSEFAWASGRFQLACYKEEIEANLRTAGLAGFQLLDLHDYVGQGTALVGVLDPFWESKGYVSAAEFRRFCDRTVPLARLRNQTFTTDDTLNAELEVAHYGDAALTNAVVRWAIRDAGGKVLVQEQLGPRDIAIGRSQLGRISFELGKLPAPAAYRLEVVIEPRFTYSVRHGANDWNFWLYPARDSRSVPTDVLVTSSWDEAEERLNVGGKVLFVPRNTSLGWDCPPLDHVPIFWNRLMNPGWGRMLGLWCDTNHPALAAFPTEPNCDWQWTQVIRGVRPINLSRFPSKLQPIVSAIDDWNRNWKLGAIFECRVGSGKLMVSSFDITSDLPRRPVARQLCWSLLGYMGSEKFQPAVEVAAADFRSVLFDSRIMQKLGAKATGEGNVAAALDGDPNTVWIAGGTGRNASGTRHPHVLTVTFAEATKFSGVVLMPRQNDRDHLGDIREYALEVSDDGQNWKPMAKGELPSSWSPFQMRFPVSVTAKHIRLTALSGYGRDSSVALADFAVLYDGPKRMDSETGNMEFRRSRSTSTDVDEGD